MTRCQVVIMHKHREAENKIFTPPWQRGFTLLTGFAALVMLLIQVKEQRCTGRRRAMARPGCELNICCYRTRADCRGGDGSSLCAALFGCRRFAAKCGAWLHMIVSSCLSLLFFFLLLQALGLLLVICDCNPRRLKKLSKEYNFGRE